MNQRSELPIVEPVENKWQRMSHEDYLNKARFMSSTDCKRLLRSAEYFMDCRVNPPAPTKSMELGTLIHSAVLEGDSFFKSAKKGPDVKLNTKVGKDEWAAFERSLLPGEKAVRANDYETVERIYERINRHPVAKGLLAGGKREISGFANDPVSGVACKIRPDFILPSAGIIMDLKTTTDASRDAFAKTIWNFHYEVSAYMYLMVSSLIERNEFETYFYLAIETDRPHSVAVYRADPAQLEIGEYLFNKAIKKYLEAKEENAWSGYQKEAEWIGLPNWALNQIQYEREIEMELAG